MRIINVISKVGELSKDLGDISGFKGYRGTMRE